MDLERDGGSDIKVERSVPRVLRRYCVYKIMTAEGKLVVSSYKETSSLALGCKLHPWQQTPDI